MCPRFFGCETGKAKLTKGYRLPCKYIIHTVGPIWQGGGFGERELLVSCYRNSLLLAAEHGCENVAFPLISTGIFGYPKAEALQAATETISAFLADHDMAVYLTVFGRSSYLISAELFSEVRSYIDDHYVAEHTEPLSCRMQRSALLGGMNQRLFEKADEDLAPMMSMSVPMACADASIPEPNLADALKILMRAFHRCC